MMMLQEQPIDNSSLGIGKDLTTFIANMGDATRGAQSLYSSTLATFKAIQDVDSAMSKVVTKLGTGSKDSEQIKESFGKAYSNVALFGGTLADIQTAQEDFLSINQRNVILTSENLTDLVAVGKVTGLAAKDLLTGFQNAGFSLDHISDVMTQVAKTARDMGVNSQAVSKLVTDNLEKLNKFGFGNGVEGLTKMAAKAASLRMDMSSTMKVANDIFERGPEAAIEISSALQRLGVTSGALLDPLAFTNLAQNNLPELQNQLVNISKQFTVFDEKTKTFEIMPGARKQLNEVAKSMGLTYEEFAKMSLESSKMEKKLAEIDFSKLSGNMTEEDKALITNLAEMNVDKGEYTVKIKDTNTGEYFEKAISELNQEDLKQLQKDQLGDSAEMKDIAYQQLGLQGQMVAQQVALNNSISMLIATTDLGNSLLKTAQETQTKVLGLEKTGDQKTALDLLNANNQETVKAMSGMGTDINKLFQELSDGNIVGMGESFLGLGEKIGKLGGDVISSQIQNLSFTDIMITAGTKLLNAGDKLSSFADAFKKLVGVQDSIITPDGIVTPLPQDSIITMTEGEKFKNNLLNQSSPQPNQTAMINKESFMMTGQKTESSPKEINVNVNFTHEVSKGVDIDVAQQFTKSLRENTTLQQNLTRTIQETMSNLGLTSV